jgi:hypothetical protein
MPREISTMKNNFVKIILNRKNEFKTFVDISIPSIKINNVEQIDVKIDTGCPYTSIPVAKLGISATESQRLKQADCGDDTIAKEISFGVNDSIEKRQKDKELFKNRQYMILNSISFRHSDVAISIGGVKLEPCSVKLSYDRTGDILIGMDILKDWDIHIGNTEIGETVFLACPNNQLNDEYYKELNRLFKTGDRIITKNQCKFHKFNCNQ